MLSWELWPEGEPTPFSKVNFWLRQDPRAECSRSVMINSWPLELLATKQHLMKLSVWLCLLTCCMQHGCWSWCHIMAHCLEMPHWHMGVQTTQPSLSRYICLGYSPANTRADLHFHRHSRYGIQGWKGMWSFSQWRMESDTWRGKISKFMSRLSKVALTEM